MKPWKKWVAFFAALAFLLLAAMLVFTALRTADSQYGDPCAGAGKPPAGTSPEVVTVTPSKSQLVVFGSTICVAVRGLADELAKKQPLILFLNGEPLASTASVKDVQKELVSFRLDRTEQDAAVWSRLIGAPPVFGDNGGRVVLNVSVGRAGEAPLSRKDDAQITFLVFSRAALWSGLGALAAAVAALAFLAANTGILRDGDADSAYSLGRCQMAFWLYLVTASFIYIWLVTGEISGVLTSDALVLIGISGSTGLAAMYIPPVPAAAPPPSTERGLARFLTDILSSDMGGAKTIQLHRIQMAVWTLILGVAFVWEVYSSFRMPKFDTNLLIMMGISGSLYLGFKFKEA